MSTAWCINASARICGSLNYAITTDVQAEPHGRGEPPASGSAPRWWRIRIALLRLARSAGEGRPPAAFGDCAAAVHGVGGRRSFMSEGDMAGTRADEEDERPKKRRSWIGIMAIVALASGAFLLGRYVPARATSPKAACLENLRAIQQATLEWTAVSQRQTTNRRPTWDDLRPYLIRYNKSHYACPEGGSYSLGTQDTPATCSHPGHTLNGQRGSF